MTDVVSGGQKNEFPVVIAHGVGGWALCAVTMGVGMRFTALQSALIIHAIAAPLIFAGLSAHYFRRHNAWSPLKTATTFLSTVAALDFFVVALVIERSFVMFASVLGVWLPFLLIFTASWLTGLALLGPKRRAIVPSSNRNS